MILRMERSGPVPRDCGKLAAAKSRPRPPLVITRATKVPRFRSEWERKEFLWDLLCLEEDCLVSLEGTQSLQDPAPPQVVSDSDEELLEAAKKVLEALNDDGE